ncbi:MAG TPA: alanine--tRNA ligase [Chitinophagaceae bacterium]|nr:alanine--tRNA ligase [Chitinophagaceae bacterium]HNM34502.1 alanine--tRNA ligase [Chitinophagaceae bacterium]
MTSAEIRQHFLNFFESKKHEIVASAPIVVKDDPTLLFTNAGMNQFKDYFLGNKEPKNKRIADTQKCLRVSGKHNDLEEVGVDTYHHTMFEMLGNWSFGDYFKTEAIAWSWELLTEIYKLDKDRLYVTIFEGDEKEGLPKDNEAYNEWKKVIAEDRILLGNKKDNFWEMGDTGPCGPCTEIHVDCRMEEERKLVDGKLLVNNDHPQVIEIWNNVFIQFNRKKDGSLEQLPAKHVDTGMGFERLVRVIQKKSSNYDTDVFTKTIAAVENITEKKYDFGDNKQAIAFRVLADHIRAISFTIADGQLPSNTGAGYVIRRILRRAVRYYYSYLEYQQPLLFQLVPVISTQFQNVFPELYKQKDFVSKVVKEEEEAFLRTLNKGLKLIDEIIVAANANQLKSINGNDAFELYDTFGFPIDLTRLIAAENNLSIDEEGFEIALQQQKKRSRAATIIDTEDWIIINEGNSVFVGYNQLSIETKILKYRKVKAKGKESYQIVLAETPFYAESGGQVGDKGWIDFGNCTIEVFDIKKENNLSIHFVTTLPESINLTGNIIATVNKDLRKETANNHTATHLLHAALRNVLGSHVAQKGSLVNHENLRFDFSHFAKVTDDEIAAIEKIVNTKIRENIPVIIKEMKKEEAVALGAMALFGEKYGDVVRVVIIDPNYSVELCGGTHVTNTGELGFFKIKHETAVSAGVRRIEALSGAGVEEFINNQLLQLQAVKNLFNNPKELLKVIENNAIENKELKKKIESFEAKQIVALKAELNEKVEIINNTKFIGAIVDVNSADNLKKLVIELKQNADVAILATNIIGKSNVVVMINEAWENTKSLDATKIIKEHIAPVIKGGGGGSKNIATAGGQEASNLPKVIDVVKALL